MGNTNNDSKINIETVTCNNCNTVFSTEHPFKYLTPCKCENISCDVDKFYIRTAFQKLEDYTYRVNGKIVIIEDNQVCDNDFDFRVSKKNEK